MAKINIKYADGTTESFASESEFIATIDSKTDKAIAAGKQNELKPFTAIYPDGTEREFFPFIF